MNLRIVITPLRVPRPSQVPQPLVATAPVATPEFTRPIAPASLTPEPVTP